MAENRSAGAPKPRLPVSGEALRRSCGEHQPGKALSLRSSFCRDLRLFGTRALDSLAVYLSSQYIFGERESWIFLICARHEPDQFATPQFGFLRSSTSRPDSQHLPSPFPRPDIRAGRTASSRLLPLSQLASHKSLAQSQTPLHSCSL